MATVLVSPSAPFSGGRTSAQVSAELTKLGFKVVPNLAQAVYVCSCEGDTATYSAKVKKLVQIVSEKFFKDYSAALKKGKPAPDHTGYVIEPGAAAKPKKEVKEPKAKAAGKRKAAEVGADAAEPETPKGRPKKRAKKAPAAFEEEIEDGNDGEDEELSDEDALDLAAVEGTVLEDATGRWDVVLTLKDPAKNQNKYFVLQLLVLKYKKKRTLYQLNTMWGRIGYPGGWDQNLYVTAELAQDAFKKKFREKSKNTFGAPYKAVPGKYVLVDQPAKKKSAAKAGKPAATVTSPEHPHPVTWMPKSPYPDSDFWGCNALICLEERRISNGPAYHCTKCSQFDAHPKCVGQ